MPSGTPPHPPSPSDPTAAPPPAVCCCCCCCCLLTARQDLLAMRNEGSQRDSRESVPMNTTSCSDISSSSVCRDRSIDADVLAAAPLPDGDGADAADASKWPGMGISNTTPLASTSGRISRNASQAASTLGRPLPPSAAASWCLKRLCLTGLDMATLPLSTKVMCLAPQAMSALAIAHPRVPAPSRRKRIELNLSGSNCGTMRHLMSLTLRSTALACMVVKSR
mmetsp:Transcript_30864/g.89803  ORF Transcript_30864/g.89803 Transcript_30864/m.89803 type:complete len:223 (+) Transcript_30864:1626-2294(+)